MFAMKKMKRMKLFSRIESFAASAAKNSRSPVKSLVFLVAEM